QQLSLYVTIEPKESRDEKIINHPDEEMVLWKCGGVAQDKDNSSLNADKIGSD
ncbi:hypothetical protein Q9233_016259, partial [Columba guinea]